MACCDRKAANIWTARIIPVILFGLIGYASWVVTRRLCIDYLINPPPDALVGPRVGSAIAILVIFYLLLIPVLVCYVRLISTILTKPGFVPRSPAYYAQQETAHPPQPTRRKHRSRRHASPEEKSTHETASGSSAETQLGMEKGGKGNLGLDFWQKDVFVCNYDGRPPWCSTCMNFKPDRAHHCSEVGRCVMKMDHFCPWVGGIISETSIKVFMQFVAYTSLFTLHTLVCMAVFYGERHSKTGYVNVHYILSIALAAMFLLFSAGMTLSTVQMAWISTTTVESFTRRTKAYHLAVLIPRPDLGPPNGEPPRFMTITYPRPPEEQALLQQHSGHVPQDSVPADSPPFPQSSRPSPAEQASSHYIAPRTFAILSTKQGENPFNLGILENLKQVLGNNYIDWLLPLRYSPCIDHSSGHSIYKMNEAVIKRLQIEAGLAAPDTEEMATQQERITRKHHHHRRRKSSRYGENNLSNTQTGTIVSRDESRRKHRRHRHGKRQERTRSRTRSHDNGREATESGIEMPDMDSRVR